MQEILWETYVTLRIVLDQKDVHSTDIELLPLYLQVPRVAYLHSALKTIYELWRDVLPKNLPERPLSPWFEYHRLPLLIDVPAGVLYDLFVPEHDEEPWNLILHVTDYPYTTLPPYFGENTIKSYMFNSLKEASFVALGTAAKVNFMVSAAKDDMWQAVTNGALQMYRNILESVGFARDMFPHGTKGEEAAAANEPEDSESSLSQHGTNGGGSKKHIPLRLYAKKSGEYLSSYADVLRVSTRVSAYKSTGEATTLKDALIHRLGRWLDLTSTDRNNNAQHHVDKDETEEQNAAVLTRIAKVIIGGLSFTSKDIMEGSRGTDICGLHREMHGPDYFLYVIVHIK